MKINAVIFLAIIMGCNKVDPNTAIIPKVKTEHLAEDENSEEKTIINLNNEIVDVLKIRIMQNFRSTFILKKAFTFLCTVLFRIRTKFL